MSQITKAARRIANLLVTCHCGHPVDIHARAGASGVIGCCAQKRGFDPAPLAPYKWTQEESLCSCLDSFEVVTARTFFDTED